MSSDRYIRDTVVPISWKISLDFQVQADRFQQLSLSFKVPIFVSGSKSKNTATATKMFKKLDFINPICVRSQICLGPVHLEVSQSHGHFIHNRRDCSIAFELLLDEMVLDGQEAKVSNDDVQRGGRLGEKNHRRVEVDVESNSSASLRQFLHTWRCFFSSLNSHFSEGVFSRLEIIDKNLKQKETADIKRRINKYLDIMVWFKICDPYQDGGDKLVEENDLNAPNFKCDRCVNFRHVEVGVSFCCPCVIYHPEGKNLLICNRDSLKKGET